MNETMSILTVVTILHESDDLCGQGSIWVVNGLVDDSAEHVELERRGFRFIGPVGLEIITEIEKGLLKLGDLLPISTKKNVWMDEE